MTKEECAIVTLYTGVSMLEGDDLEYLYRYAEKLMERPVYTHELAMLSDELKERAKPDFIHLCRWASAQPKHNDISTSEQPKMDRLGVKTGETCTDTIGRQAAIDALRDEFKRTPTNAIRAMDTIKKLPPAQPDRSLWFRIGEICVDESKGFISAGRAIEKIRELLREAERREE